MKDAYKIRNAAIEFAITCNENKPEFIQKYKDEIESIIGIPLPSMGK